MKDTEFYCLQEHVKEQQAHIDNLYQLIAKQKEQIETQREQIDMLVEIAGIKNEHKGV